MRRRLIEFVVLLAVAIGAGPVGASIWQWSTTAGSNDSADPSINWKEGMAPSAVNDSARAMMAAIAAWRNDISATNTTAGTSTAYTLTTSEGVSSPPANGQMLAFIAHATNGVSPTLAVDGGTAYPIWLNGSAVASGSLILGSPYRAAFSVANSAWLLEGGPSNPYNTALGAIMWSTAPTAPNSSFVAPSGQCISTTTYAAYWVQQGSPASGACPGGQFAIIDMRGRAPVALDTLNASAANRLTSSSSGCGTAMTSVGAVCANGAESGTLTLAQMPVHSHTVTDPGHTHTVTGPANILTSAAGTSLSTPGGFSVAANASLTAQNATTGISVQTAGSGSAAPRVMPVVGLIPYLRIL